MFTITASKRIEMITVTATDSEINTKFYFMHSTLFILGVVFVKRYLF